MSEKILLLPLSKIGTSGGTQIRELLNQETIAEYAEAERAGAEFPPLIVWFDGKDYWLGDGFHRYHAKLAAGRKHTSCVVREGTLRDAILFACGCNADHGLRRTLADKQKAVRTLLQDAEWQKWSNREIARRCCVSEPMVRGHRDSIRVENADRKRLARRGDQVYEMTPAAKPGRYGQKKAAEKAPRAFNKFQRLADELARDPLELAADYQARKALPEEGDPGQDAFFRKKAEGLWLAFCDVARKLRREPLELARELEMQELEVEENGKKG